MLQKAWVVTKAQNPEPNKLVLHFENRLAYPQVLNFLDFNIAISNENLAVEDGLNIGEACHEGTLILKTLVETLDDSPLNANPGKSVVLSITLPASFEQLMKYSRLSYKLLQVGSQPLVLTQEASYDLSECIKL